MIIPPPPGLRSLVQSFDGWQQRPTVFRASTWEDGLAALPPCVTALLTDDRYTELSASETNNASGDRTVARGAIRSCCESTDLQDARQVLSVFVLTMAWGSGLKSGRSIRNTARALSEDQAAHAVLASSARDLRRSTLPLDGMVQHAHAEFALPGVRQPFFTKWFAFAGYVPERTWQPLILDSRVGATLNRTFAVTTHDMAGTSRRSRRYAAYVDTMHRWATDLTSDGCAVSADRLEWILFAHAGKPWPLIPDTSYRQPMRQEQATTGRPMPASPATPLPCEN